VRARSGRNKPSVYEVARLAGVSTATVSRVLAGHERVLPGTRDKVLTAVSELGYVPSGAARDLAARRTGVLGLCFPDLAEDESDAAYWYDEVIRGMERAARRSGYAVLIAASHHRHDGGLVLSIAGRCDGLVVLARTAPLTMLEHVAVRIPVVLLATRGGEGDRAIDYLTVANETGAYQVTSHLVDAHGYTDICFIAGPSDSPDSASRHDGFREAAAGLGRQPADAPAYRGDFTTAGGRRVAERIIATRRVPRALVCANDQMAIGAMAALRDAGLSVPADVAVTGFDGIQLGRHLRPSLTTVVQPMAALGDTAVAMLKDRIGGAALPQRTVELPVRLELRGSCGCPELGGGTTREAMDEAQGEIPVAGRCGRHRDVGPGNGPRGGVPGQRLRRAEPGAPGAPAGRRARHLEVPRHGRRPGHQPADGQHHLRRRLGHAHQRGQVHLRRQHRVYLWAVVSARDLGLINEPQARARIEATLTEVRHLQRYDGFLYQPGNVWWRSWRELPPPAPFADCQGTDPDFSWQGQWPMAGSRQARPDLLAAAERAFPGAASGRVPTLRDIQSALSVGQPKAQQVQAHFPGARVTE
jgi:LacI family transcriptional regulator